MLPSYALLTLLLRPLLLLLLPPFMLLQGSLPGVVWVGTH
jgi:hypothetical protein